MKKLDSTGFEISENSLLYIRSNLMADGTEDNFRAVIAELEALQLSAELDHVQLMGFNDKDTGRKKYRVHVTPKGLLAKAERTGKYAGWIGPEFYNEKTGTWSDVWLDDQPPKAARAGIRRKDWDQPCFMTARFSSYAKTYKDRRGNIVLENNWKTMPEIMLGKCALSAALKAAFPADLDGLTTEFEALETELEGLTEPVQVKPEPEPEPEPEHKIMSMEKLQESSVKMVVAFGKKGIGIDEIEAFTGKTLTYFKEEDIKLLRSAYARLESKEIDSLSDLMAPEEENPFVNGEEKYCNGLIETAKSNI